MWMTAVLKYLLFRREETILLKKKPGDINLECDLIGKYVEKLLFGKAEEDKNNFRRHYRGISGRKRIYVGGNKENEGI